MGVEEADNPPDVVQLFQNMLQLQRFKIKSIR